jgi:hypothetical protein
MGTNGTVAVTMNARPILAWNGGKLGHEIVAVNDALKQSMGQMVVPGCRLNSFKTNSKGPPVGSETGRSHAQIAELLKTPV